MSKKHKKNLQQLIKKRQQLELANRDVVATPAAPSQPILAAPTASSALPLVVDQPTKLPNSQNHLEVVHTLGSFVLILALLGVAIYLDFRTPFLSEVSDWLYRSLRLNS